MLCQIVVRDVREIIVGERRNMYAAREDLKHIMLFPGAAVWRQVVVSMW